MSDVLPVDATITIRAETSVADPDTCKFTASQTVHPGGPFFFHAKELAAGSPLAERLFALPGVAHVLVAENVVTVGKDSGASWAALKPGIGTVIRVQLVTGCRPSSRPLAPQARGGAPTPRFVRLFRNSWTGKSTVPSRPTAGRFPLST
jgi:Scaffold protein Nfu/NifU N terminal